MQNVPLQNHFVTFSEHGVMCRLHLIESTDNIDRCVRLVARKSTAVLDVNVSMILPVLYSQVK